MIIKVIVPKYEAFCYQGLLIQRNEAIKENIDHRIEIGWMIWEMLLGVLCEKKMLARLEEKCYNTIFVSTMLYDMECWATKREHTHKMSLFSDISSFCGKT